MVILLLAALIGIVTLVSANAEEEAMDEINKKIDMLIERMNSMKEIISIHDHLIGKIIHLIQKILKIIGL